MFTRLISFNISFTFRYFFILFSISPANTAGESNFYLFILLTFSETSKNKFDKNTGGVYIKKMIDEKIIKKLEPRMKKIEGQIRGVNKMINKKEYCIDILQQIAAVQGALKSIACIILTNHINTCVKETIESKNTMEIKETVNEVIEMYEKFIK